MQKLILLSLACTVCTLLFGMDPVKRRASQELSGPLFKKEIVCSEWQREPWQWLPKEMYALIASFQKKQTTIDETIQKAKAFLLVNKTAAAALADPECTRIILTRFRKLHSELSLGKIFYKCHGTFYRIAPLEDLYILMQNCSAANTKGSWKLAQQVCNGDLSLGNYCGLGLYVDNNLKLIQKHVCENNSKGLDYHFRRIHFFILILKKYCLSTAAFDQRHFFTNDSLIRHLFTAAKAPIQCSLERFKSDPKKLLVVDVLEWQDAIAWRNDSNETLFQSLYFINRVSLDHNEKEEARICIDLLLLYGIDLLAKSKDNKTTFEHASSKSKSKTVAFLNRQKKLQEPILPSKRIIKNNDFVGLVRYIKQGGDINWQDEEGNSFVHLVYKHKPKDMDDFLEYLFSRGANLTLRNKNGELATGSKTDLNIKIQRAVLLQHMIKELYQKNKRVTEII